jgi:hypothetical protein
MTGNVPVNRTDGPGQRGTAQGAALRAAQRPGRWTWLR